MTHTQLVTDKQEKQELVETINNVSSVQQNKHLNSINRKHETQLMIMTK